MKHMRKNKILCFLLTASIIFSGLFINIINSKSILSQDGSNNTYFDNSIYNIVTSSVSKLERTNPVPSLLPKHKANHYTFHGFRGLCGIASSLYYHKYYSAFLSIISINICETLHSHTIVLNYIHHKDGKK